MSENAHLWLHLPHKKYSKIGVLGHIPVEISDEDHLHFEVLIDGEPVDPLAALNKVKSNEDG